MLYQEKPIIKFNLFQLNQIFLEILKVFCETQNTPKNDADEYANMFLLASFVQEKS